MILLLLQFHFITPYNFFQPIAEKLYKNVFFRFAVSLIPMLEIFEYRTVPVNQFFSLQRKLLFGMMQSTAHPPVIEAKTLGHNQLIN